MTDALTSSTIPASALTALTDKEPKEYYLNGSDNVLPVRNLLVDDPDTLVNDFFNSTSSTSDPVNSFASYANWEKK